MCDVQPAVLRREEQGRARLHPEQLYPAGPRLFDDRLGRGAGERMPPVPRKRWPVRGLGEARPHLLSEPVGSGGLCLVSQGSSIPQDAEGHQASCTAGRAYLREQETKRYQGVPVHGMEQPDGRIGDHLSICPTRFAVLVWTPNAPVG